MPPKTNISKNKRVYFSKNWENWQDQFNLYIINPDELKEKICEELENNFSLSKDEAKDYYEMIKDDENNKIIKEIEKKIKVRSTNNIFEVEYNYGDYGKE